jgi:hypothetical protein
MQSEENIDTKARPSPLSTKSFIDTAKWKRKVKSNWVVEIFPPSML